MFPLFPRSNLNELLPAIEKKEHYCAFALQDHGSVTFQCDANTVRSNFSSVETSGGGGGGDGADFRDHESLFKVLNEAIRVKAYYPIIHTLRSFGTDFKFTDKQLATCASVRKVFESFLYIAERLEWWGTHGVMKLAPAGAAAAAVDDDGDDAAAAEHESVNIEKSLFKKQVSCLRIEASFVLSIPASDFDGKTSFGSNQTLDGGWRCRTIWRQQRR